MKTTEIHIWGFANEFMVEVKRKKGFLTMAEAQEWTLKNTVDTATVIKIVHKMPKGDLTVYNEEYKKFEPGSGVLERIRRKNLEKNETITNE